MTEPDQIQYRIVACFDGRVWRADVEIETQPGLGLPHAYWKQVIGYCDSRKDKAIALADKEIVRQKAENAAWREQQATMRETTEILNR